MSNANRFYLSLFVLFAGIIALVMDLYAANFTFTNISPKTLIFVGLIVFGIYLIKTTPQGKK